MSPKLKVPGRGTRPDILGFTQDGELKSVVCECQCGGGLVFRDTGEVVSCHFCGSTWEGRIDHEAEVIVLKSSVAENVMPMFRFRKMTVNS